MFDTATERDTNLDIRAKHQQTLARRGHILRHFAIRVSLIQPSAPHELIAEDAISANGDLKNDFLYVLQYADETVLPAHRQLLKHIYGIDDLDGVFEDRLVSLI